MDRREALKKLAVGGGAVLGASTIVSSPVFAYTVPTIPNPTSTTPTQMTGLFTVTQPAATTCPASASSTTYTTELTGDGGIMSATNMTGAELMVSGDFPDANATYMFTVTTTLVCMYVGGDASRVCTTEFTTTRSGGMGDFTPPVSGGTICVPTTP